ncbi:unnamed protein product [Arabis nemorensis]|uniref:Glutamyl/glutaminyl-tRNA synthetase class Ib catalytic domain-containing protein n=1 Tax=Arabis nemorensis TaxID=586526 RepID=A0A565BM84_9BRAS|nr:unnamed protein product [Arabis nemorensis]
MAEKFIRQGKAYVDDTDPDLMCKHRIYGVESRCRNQSVDENLKLPRNKKHEDAGVKETTFTKRRFGSIKLMQWPCL